VIQSDFDDWRITKYEEWINGKRRQYADTDYSVLFGHFYQEPKERQLYIEREIEGKKPTFGYLYLAGLVAENRVNRILTTNFDDLLHDALMKYYDIKPIVCSFDSAVAGIRVASQRPKIIKLHGDFLFDNIRNMKHELKGLDANMEEKMYEMCKDSGMIVVGYSGGDESVMAPIRDMIRKTDYLNMGLHWCIQRPKEGDCVELPPKLQDLKNYHGERVHIYRIENFDRLMEEMFIACHCNLPKVLSDPHRNNLPREFYDSVIAGSGIELTHYMKENLKMFADRSIGQADTSDHKVFHADTVYQLGREARKEDRLDKAKKLFEESRKELDEVLQGEIESEDLEVKALRRKSGVCIALAKIFRQEGRDDWKEQLQASMSAIEKGKRLCRSLEGLVPDALRFTFYHNTCCVISLLAESDNRLSREDKEKVIQNLVEIRKRDYEGDAVQKVLGDDDFSFCYKRMKKDIDVSLFG
jgi:hypothetical protein